MIAITTISLLILFCCAVPRNSFGSMLPLEVIEITQQPQHHHQHSAQVYNITSSEFSSVVGLSSRWSNLLNSNNNNNNNNNSTSSAGISISSGSGSNSNSSSNSNSNSDSSSISNTNSNSNINTNDIKHKSVYNHRSKRRRSRQMLDMLQPQGTRILYQVGNSEEDLPICAPNAVCSKIDLYETPWIERQCRCPDAVMLSSSSTKTRQIITHHKDRQIYDQKYKHYFDTEKNIQHKRLQNFDDKKLENVHLKRLMHKLDAVFQDDIVLDENEFQDNEEADNSYRSHKNEFDIGLQKEYRMKPHEISKLRHSGHRRDHPQIGECPSSPGLEDGHTIADKTRHYKLCNPIHKLPVCRYFRDYTWTLKSSPELNVTEQIVHCICPENSISYLAKIEPSSSGRPGSDYSFACSPPSRLRCQRRKEPCKLFTVRKRQEFLDEVNTNTLCQCPKGYRCPKHHTDSGVIAGKTFVEDNIQTYSGYCMEND